ncbi:glycosyltransferase [Helicobacter suis]|uniref:glycosyltransferase n=1 Tax=Helicobacter suis TaxID=104628 RepID=UPI001F31DC29|nr:glycosyltransferase [Helicobacter suis]
MKVLHLNATLTGGAAQAALRLHYALLKKGVDSYVWLQDLQGGVLSDRILGPRTRLAKALSLMRPYLDKAPVLLYPKRKKGTFNLGWLPFSPVLSMIKKIDPDIVHLHWIGRGMLPLRDLPKIKKPLVWTLHDMWAFTGGDHYYTDEDEHVYKHSCILNSPFVLDLATLGFWMKQRAYAKIPQLAIVGVSNWIFQCAQKSALLQDKQHFLIGNPIDTQIYKPMDKEFCRQLLGLNTSKKLVGFGANIADPIKGYDLLEQALEKLDPHLEIELVIFGSQFFKKPSFPFKTHFLGRLSDATSLVALYNALDVTLAPSRQENLSNIVMESLACCTPVVAFAVGGLLDLITHKENGYLARPFDIEDLKAGIEWVLTTQDYTRLCEHARNSVLDRFSEHVIARQMLNLYKEILHKI